MAKKNMAKYFHAVYNKINCVSVLSNSRSPFYVRSHGEWKNAHHDRLPRGGRPASSLPGHDLQEHRALSGQALCEFSLQVLGIGSLTQIGGPKKPAKLTAIRHWWKEGGAFEKKGNWEREGGEASGDEVPSCFHSLLKIGCSEGNIWLYLMHFKR